VTASELLKMIRNVTVWKRGEQRAPHKPLLILYALGKCYRDEERLIPYRDVDRDLRKLLLEFGPPRKNVRPEYPFWRLKNEEIWILTNANDIKTTSSGDAIKRDLISRNVAGGFAPDVYNILIRNPHLIRSIVQDLLVRHFPESLHNEILQQIGIDLTGTSIRRSRVPGFRERVLDAYEYKCGFCGFDVRLSNLSVGLEAAHIKWHQAHGPDIVPNGIALCPLHHKLFDLGAVTLTKEYKIVVSEKVNGGATVNVYLLSYHRNDLFLPQRQEYFPDPLYIQWHNDEVFRMPARH
jgi:putative restriction endonuclease